MLRVVLVLFQNKKSSACSLAGPASVISDLKHRSAWTITLKSLCYSKSDSDCDWIGQRLLGYANQDRRQNILVGNRLSFSFVFLGLSRPALSVHWFILGPQCPKTKKKKLNTTSQCWNWKTFSKKKMDYYLFLFLRWWATISQCWNWKAVLFSFVLGRSCATAEQVHMSHVTNQCCTCNAGDEVNLHQFATICYNHKI